MGILSDILAALQKVFGIQPLSPETLEKDLDALAAKRSERLDWRHSIVDLMKLVDLDSSLSNRKQLAQELGYTGTLDGSAEMNLWLHKHVMLRLAKDHDTKGLA